MRPLRTGGRKRMIQPWHHWNGFRPAGIPINAGKQVSVALGRRQRTKDIGMNAVKAGVRRRKGLLWGFDMSVDLRLLTVIHVRVQVALSRFMFGQTYRSETKRREALIPGCDKECRLSNTARRIAEGTRGRGRPMETSQRRVLLECGIGTCFSCKEVEEVKRLLRS